MSGGIPESDWKVFRQLHRIALERYCQRILDEVARITADTHESAHERYLKIYKVIRERDRTIRELFDDFRRSTAIMQLLMINSHGLMTEDEMGRFTQGTRDMISCVPKQRTEP